MKIVHLCLNSPFTEGWGYRENLLAKYHAPEQILAHNQYLHMRHAAEKHGFEFFSYQSIALLVIDEAMQ